MHPPLESDEEGLSKNVMGSGIVVVVLALTVILFLPLSCFLLPLLFQPQYVIAASLASPYWDSCDVEYWIDTLKG